MTWISMSCPQCGSSDVMCESGPEQPHCHFCVTCGYDGTYGSGRTIASMIAVGDPDADAENQYRINSRFGTP